MTLDWAKSSYIHKSTIHKRKKLVKTHKIKHFLNLKTPLRKLKDMPQFIFTNCNEHVNSGGGC